MPKRLTIDNFIEKSTNIHKDKYNYSMVKYENVHKKVIIICNEHGEFFQDPKNHMKGVGCPICALKSRSSKRRLSVEEFIKRANIIHQDKYNYSKFIYTNNSTKGIIICPIHGEFTQSPNSHLTQKHGCPKCGILKFSKEISLTKKEFVNRANIIHKNKYDYTKTIYKLSNRNVIIICPKHGEFLQLPGNHLMGEGCYKCGREKSGKKCSKTSIQFIKDANKSHNNYYDYSESNYINSNTKVKIICPKHGSFFQSPHNHVNSKNGCPKCSTSISKSEIEFLNYLNIPDTKENRQIKILKKTVDGYDFVTNTVYEFLGDYWHGNPERHNLNHYNKVCKKTFRELYTKTFKKFDMLKEKKYIVKYIWENDWKKFKKRIVNEPKILTH